MSLTIRDFGSVEKVEPKSLNPTWLFWTNKYNGGTTTQTIDLEKSYLIFASLKDDRGSEASDVWSIVKGVLTQIRSASSNGSVTLNDTTVTFKGNSSSRWTVFELVQLD